MNLKHCGFIAGCAFLSCFAGVISPAAVHAVDPSESCNACKKYSHTNFEEVARGPAQPPVLKCVEYDNENPAHCAYIPHYAADYYIIDPDTNEGHWWHGWENVCSQGTPTTTACTLPTSSGS